MFVFQPPRLQAEITEKGDSLPSVTEQSIDLEVEHREHSADNQKVDRFGMRRIILRIDISFGIYN